MDRWTDEDRQAHEQEMRAQGAVSAGAQDALFRLTQKGLTLAQAQDAILRELRGLVDRPHVHREGRTLPIPVPTGPNAAPPRRPPPPPLGGRLGVPGASIPGVLPPPIPPPPLRVQAPDLPPPPPPLRVQAPDLRAPDLDLSDVRGGDSPPPLEYEP